MTQIQNRSKPSYPWRELAIGQWFVVERSGFWVRVQASRMGMKMDRRFSVQQLDDGSMRVTRVV